MGELVGHSNSLALVLFLERSGVVGKPQERGWPERLVDVLVPLFQPSPQVVHAELLLVSHDGLCWHFSTYMGDRAQWRDDDPGYYRAHHWRAVPLDGTSVEALAQECDRAISTPYSLLRYPFATRVLGVLAPLLPEGVGRPAQCASLTARIAKSAMPNGPELMPWSAPRYSPSMLHNHLCQNAARMDIGTIVEDHEAIGVLVGGAQADLANLGPQRRAAALKALAIRAREHIVGRLATGEALDPYELRTLAWAGLRVASLADGKAVADQKANTTTASTAQPMTAATVGHEIVDQCHKPKWCETMQPLMWPV